MKNNQNDCCEQSNNKNNKVKNEIRSGILFSLIPHSFCVALVIFSIVGSVGLTSFLKKILVIPYFFSFLIIFSAILATISALFYLKKTGNLSLSGIKNKWKYLTTLYGTMLVVNVLVFFVIFPITTNWSAKKNIDEQIYSEKLSLRVDIPCSGHAPIVTYELEQDEGIGNIIFKNPNTFNIKYNPDVTSPEKIKSLEIFKTFKLKNI